MVRQHRIFVAFIVMMFGGVLMALQAQAASTPAAPPCVAKKILGVRNATDCTARNAYNDVAFDTIVKLKNPKTGAAALDRLAVSVLGGGSTNSSTVRYALDVTRRLIYSSYNARDYDTASCIRTELLQSYVIHAKRDGDAKELQNALSIVDQLVKKRPLRLTYTAQTYPKLGKAAPKLAKVMSSYNVTHGGGLMAMYC